MTSLFSLQNGTILQQIGAVFGVKTNPYFYGKDPNADSNRISYLNSSTWKVWVAFDRFQKTKESIQETDGKGLTAFVITSRIRATIEMIPLVSLSLMIVDFVVDLLCKKPDISGNTKQSTNNLAVTSHVEVEL